jgi:hypothetical protein
MLLLLGATRAEHPTASARPPLTPHSHTAAAQVSTTTAAGSRAPTAHQDTLPLDPFSRFAPLNLRSKSKTSDSIRSSSRYRQHATALVGGPALSPLVLTPCWGANTGKTAFAVRQKIYRALSIGRTANATLCLSLCFRKSSYEAQKLLRVLKMPYEAIDACTNGCVLFRKEHAYAKYCPKCKSSRYLELDSGGGHKRQLDVPVKILRYLPLSS